MSICSNNMFKKNCINPLSLVDITLIMVVHGTGLSIII